MHAAQKIGNPSRRLMLVAAVPRIGISFRSKYCANKLGQSSLVSRRFGGLVALFSKGQQRLAATDPLRGY
jgi:hypothetical protein